MRLLEKMETDMILLWTQAMDAKSPDLLSELMEKYQLMYRGYKKQVRFFEAMKDHKQINSNIQLNEQQMQN
jgi:hypothetical protein